MSQIATVTISQPHVEQIHMYLEQATSELARLRSVATSVDPDGLKKIIDELEYLIMTARQSLPPTQQEFPF